MIFNHPQAGSLGYAISDEQGAKEKYSGQPAMNRSKQAGMGIKAIVVLMVGLALASVHLADAQQATKIPRIAFLGTASASVVAARIEAFREGLRKLGYLEGENIAIEYRFGEGKSNEVTSLAVELARSKVDVIVTAGPAATRSAKEATVTIPIVMGNEGDPVGSGFVASLARPGGNITGLSNFAPEISGKQLEILKDIVPKLSRVTVLGTSTNPGNAQALKEIELAARVLGMRVQYLEVRVPKDIETAFRSASKGRADAVLALRNPVTTFDRKQVIKLAVKNRIPAIYHSIEFVEDGGLMTYSVSINDLFRRAATYVDKILKGAKPADLPVEQPTKFEFIINLKAAKQIGLTIPPNVLARADKVIK
jgi:putative ABC transport system substrate-binding protein